MAFLQFKLLGFPVRVHPFFVLVVVVLSMPPEGLSADAFGHIAVWLGVLFVSILWHEMGHALAMRRHGYAPMIELHGLGGRTRWGRGPKYPAPGTRIKVSLAGPFAGFLLGGTLLLLRWLVPIAQGPAILAEAVQLMIWVNLGWGAVNLVPMVPWDGGLAMHGLFDLIWPKQAHKIAGVVTLVVAGGVAFLVFTFLPGSYWLYFLLFLSVSAGVSLFRRPPPTQTAPHADVPALTYDRFRTHVQSLEPVALIFSVLRRSTHEPWASMAKLMVSHAETLTLPDKRAEALEYCSWAYLLGGDVEGAKRCVASMRPAFDPSPPLAACLAIEEERFLDVLDLVDEDGGDQAELLRAYALCALGRVDACAARPVPGRVADLALSALFFRGRYQNAADFGAALFAITPNPTWAFNTACSFARMEQRQTALEWLDKAVRHGLAPHVLDHDSDIDNLREMPEFKALRQRMAAGRENA